MSQVTFRRIHGRIVPIKISDERKTGAKQVAAGVAVGTTAGILGSDMIQASAHAEKDARALGSKSRLYQKLGDRGSLGKSYANKKAIKAGKEAMQAAIKSKKFEKASFRIRSGGAIAAGALIGAGVHKLVGKETKHSEEIAGASAVAGGFAVHHAYYKGVGNRSMQAAKIAIKKLLRK